MEEELNDFLERVDKTNKQINELMQGKEIDETDNIKINVDEDGKQFNRLREERINDEIVLIFINFFYRKKKEIIGGN